MAQAEEKHMVDALSKVNLSELQTRGYVLVRNAVPLSVVERMKNDYKVAPPPPNMNYPYVRHCNFKNLGASVDNYLAVARERIAAQTDIKTDNVQEGYYWPASPEQSGKFYWHQDHETFFMNEKCYNYLNFYIVIEKERPEHANLGIVPFDKLAKVDPVLAKYAKGKGGIIYWRPENMKGRLNALGDWDKASFGPEGLNKLDSAKFPLVARDDMHGTVTPVQTDFDEIMELHDLNVGDMLLIRGDTIHRTGDNLCKRVALSIRVNLTSEAVMDINRLFTLSHDRSKPCTTQKAKMMFNNKQWATTTAIVAASKRGAFNFAKEPLIWSASDSSSLGLFGKLKYQAWWYYYQQFFKYYATKAGTKFVWQDKFPDY